MSNNDDGRYVPLGINSTIQFLRTLDAMYQRVGFPSADGPHREALRQLRIEETEGRRTPGEAPDAPPPARESSAPRHSSPADSRRGLAPEVLYEFLRGEFTQYERLAGLGFRYAESMLTFAERASRDAGPGAPPIAERVREVVVVDRDGFFDGDLRVENPTGQSVELTLSAGAFAAVDHGGPFHPEVRFGVSGTTTTRVLVPAGRDEIVQFGFSAEGFPPGRSVGEIYASGHGIHLVFRVIVQRRAAP